MKGLVIIITLLFLTASEVQGQYDTLFFKNGSTIIGELEKVKLGVVTFDPADVGDITVQLRKLKTMTGLSKIFRVETIYDQVYFGRILSHPSDNFIYVKTLSDTITMHIEDISVLYSFDKSVMQRFSGSAGVGFSYTRSSEFGRLNYDGKVKYLARKDEAILNISSIYTIYDSLLSRDKEDINLKYNYYFIRQWFATVLLAYQRNIEISIDRRYLQGAGVGNKFITSKHFYSWARGGLAFNQEKSTEGVESGVLTEIFTQIEVNFFRFVKPEISCVLEESFYYSLSEKGRFRNDGNLSISWEVFKDFDLSLEPYNNFDSKPPVSESTKLDFGVVFSIGYTF